MKTKSLKICGRSIISTFEHYIMRLRIDELTCEYPEKIILKNVTDNNMEWIRGHHSISLAKKIKDNNVGKCDIFILINDENEKVGTLSVIYKGGADIEYKINNIDAFIYNVYIKPEFRGKGYAGKMIALLMKELQSKGIAEAYLAVSTNNLSAVKAYQKTGFKVVKKSSFIRVLRINIPYHSL